MGSWTLFELERNKKYSSTWIDLYWIKEAMPPSDTSHVARFMTVSLWVIFDIMRGSNVELELISLFLVRKATRIRAWWERLCFALDAQEPRRSTELHWSLEVGSLSEGNTTYRCNTGDRVGVSSNKSSRFIDPMLIRVLEFVSYRAANERPLFQSSETNNVYVRNVSTFTTTLLRSFLVVGWN